MPHSFNTNIPGQGKGQAHPRFSWPKVRQAIELYKRLELQNIPLVWGDKKPAIKAWEPFQNRAPTLEELALWFHEGKPNGIGILCGAAGGGLEATPLSPEFFPIEVVASQQAHTLPSTGQSTKSLTGGGR